MAQCTVVYSIFILREKFAKYVSLIFSTPSSQEKKKILFHIRVFISRYLYYELKEIIHKKLHYLIMNRIHDIYVLEF